MNYYKRWNPDKQKNEFYKVSFEESVLEGETIWRMWTEEGIEGKGGKEKSEEFKDYYSFQKLMVHLHNTWIVQGYRRRNVEPILSLYV